MLSVKQLMSDYVSDLYEMESTDERFRHLEHYVTQLGFDAVIYTFVPTIRLGRQPLQPAMFHSESFPKPFLLDYLAEQWERSDFTVRYIKQQHKEVMDWHEHALSPGLREDEKALIAKAQHDYGIQNAVSIPLLYNSLGGAGASVVSSEHDAAFAKLKQERLDSLIYSIKLFHMFSIDEIKYLPFQKLLAIFSSLKPLELAVLRHLVSHRPFKAINDTCPDITRVKTAYKILDHVRSKLSDELGKPVTTDYLIHLLLLLDISTLYLEKNNK